MSQNLYYMKTISFNLSPNNKILDLPYLEACKEIKKKLDVTQKENGASDGIKNIVGKIENASYQNFSFYHNVFESPF